MTDLQEIFDWVDQHSEDFFQDLRRLCACRSVAGNPQGLDAARDCILEKMQEVGIQGRPVTVEDGNAMVYGQCPGTREKTVLFYNHYDVVEAGDRKKWKNGNPFELLREDDAMYARGISDNKGPLLSRIHAVQAILNTKGKLPVWVKFLVEGDEETASPSMFRYQDAHMEAFRNMTKAISVSGKTDGATRKEIPGSDSGFAVPAPLICG